MLAQFYSEHFGDFRNGRLENVFHSSNKPHSPFKYRMPVVSFPENIIGIRWSIELVGLKWGFVYAHLDYVIRLSVEQLVSGQLQLCMPLVNYVWSVGLLVDRKNPIDFNVSKIMFTFVRKSFLQTVYQAYLLVFQFHPFNCSLMNIHQTQRNVNLHHSGV